MRIGAVLLLGAFLVGLAGAGDNAGKLEEILKDTVGTLEKLTTTLTGIKDEESAKAAKPELKATASKWVEIRKKAEGLKPPTKDEKQRLEKEYKGKLEAAQKKLFTEIGRVKGVAGGPEALAEIAPIMDKKK